MAISVTSPFNPFFDVDGRALQDGYIYVGVENLDPQTNPVNVYLDESLSTLLAQPVRTKSGYPVNSGSPIQIYTANKFSIRVRNKNGAMVYEDLSFGGGGSGGASDVDFTQAGTGAATQTVESKLRQYLAANDYSGVDPTGVADSTVGLKAVFDYAIPLGIPVEMDGTYRITGPIQPYAAARASGGLHIVVKDVVTINVDAASTGFSDVLYFHTTAFNSASIVGGILAINGSNKAARGITIRHNDGSGGDIRITAKLKLSNFLENAASATRENSALEIYGKYGSVLIEAPYVYQVNRTNPSGGACAGVAVGDCSGAVTINDPWVERILCGPGAAVDGDGVKVFGAEPAVATEEWQGTVWINGGNYINCQGRSAKIRSSSATIISPRVRRTDSVVAIPQCVEFDFQACAQATVLDPTYEYFGTSGVAPFGPGSSHSCVAFQQTVTNAGSVARSIGGKMVSNVSFPRYGNVVVASGARRSYAEFSGLKAIAVGSLTGTMLTRGFVEFDASTVAAKADATKIVANNNEVPLDGLNILSYTGLGSLTSISQFSFEAIDNANTNSTGGRVFNALSGQRISGCGSFIIRNNRNLSDLLQQFGCNFATLVPGCRVSLDIAASGHSSAPPWGTTGTADVVCFQQSSNAAGFVTTEVTYKRNDMPATWRTINNATTWDCESTLVVVDTDISSISSYLNTTQKRLWIKAYDATNKRLMVASGTAASSPWFRADGLSSVTPA